MFQINCLRQQPVEKLLKVQVDHSYMKDQVRFGIIAYGPVVDGEILPRTPKELLQDTRSESYQLFRSYDFMTGNCNNEG